MQSPTWVVPPNSRWLRAMQHVVHDARLIWKVVHEAMDTNLASVIEEFMRSLAREMMPPQPFLKQKCIVYLTLTTLLLLPAACRLWAGSPVGCIQQDRHLQLWYDHSYCSRAHGRRASYKGSGTIPLTANLSKHACKVIVV